jgi:hypothetical protein
MAALGDPRDLGGETFGVLGQIAALLGVEQPVDRDRDRLEQLPRRVVGRRARARHESLGALHASAALAGDLERLGDAELRRERTTVVAVALACGALHDRVLAQQHRGSRELAAGLGRCGRARPAPRVRVPLRARALDRA